MILLQKRVDTAFLSDSGVTTRRYTVVRMIEVLFMSRFFCKYRTNGSKKRGCGSGNSLYYKDGVCFELQARFLLE